MILKVQGVGWSGKCWFGNRVLGFSSSLQFTGSHLNLDTTLVNAIRRRNLIKAAIFVKL